MKKELEQKVMKLETTTSVATSSTKEELVAMEVAMSMMVTLESTKLENYFDRLKAKCEYLRTKQDVVEIATNTDAYTQYTVIGKSSFH